MSQVHFSKGDRVEIRRASSTLSPFLPNGLRGGGAYYSATVLGAPASTKARILVEYDRDTFPYSSSRRLCEYVPMSMARPAPPRERGRRFQVGEAVDAYAEGGWHQGVVVEVSEDYSRHLVRLEGPEEGVEFAQTNLRLRREWTERGWDPPFPGLHVLQVPWWLHCLLSDLSCSSFSVTLRCWMNFLYCIRCRNRFLKCAAIRQFWSYSQQYTLALLRLSALQLFACSDTIPVLELDSCRENPHLLWSWSLGRLGDSRSHPTRRNLHGFSEMVKW